MAHLNQENNNLPPEQPQPNQWDPSLSGLFYGESKPRPPKIPRWKIGLGIFGVFLMLFFVLFSREIGTLLNLFGTKAQKTGAPEVHLSLDPIDDTGGPGDEINYTIDIQIEHGTYYNAAWPEDPCNPNPVIGFPGCPLPFYGTMVFSVDDLVSSYPEFIESAKITVPENSPVRNDDDPDNPMITVVEELDQWIGAIGLFNRRVSPSDLGFISKPPILTIKLTEYALSHGGGSIPFQINAQTEYIPGLGILWVVPDGQVVEVADPPAATGILNLEGGAIPTPDFTLEVIPTAYPNIDNPDPVNWGDIINFTVRLTANSDFTGDIDLSSTDLDGYASSYFDTSLAHPNGYTFSENPVINMQPDDVRDIDLTIYTKVGLTDTISLVFMVDGLSAGIPDAIYHHDNGRIDITYTPPPQDFYLTMDPPTGQIVTTANGNATYTINIIRDGYLGGVTLEALSEDLGHEGDLLDEQFGINASIIPAGPDIWTLTVTGDGTIFNQNYDFYVRGHTDNLDGSPADRWAPNNPLLPNEKNTIPAYFRIQTTPSYSLSIEPYPVATVTAGEEVIYTIRAFNPINGFDINEDIILTQDILNSPLGAYLDDVHFENDLNSMAVTIFNPIGVQLHLVTKPGVSLPDPGLPLSVDGQSQITITNPLIVTVTSSLVISRAPDFHITMDPPTDPGAVTPTGSATYIVHIVRSGFSGAITLTAESDELPTGQLLENELGIGTAIFAQDAIDPDKYTLTVTADGTVFNGNYPFYVRGYTNDLNGSPADRWAPNNPLLPNEKNTIPAYFRIQSTPGYSIRITPDPATVNSDAIATYTVEIVNPINGFDVNEQVLLTQDILNQAQLNGDLNSDFLENVYFEGDVASISTSISDGAVLLYLDTKPSVGYALPGLEFIVNGHSQDTSIDAIGMSHLVINRLPDPDFRVDITPLPGQHPLIYWGDVANFTIELTSLNDEFNGNVTLTSSQLAGFITSGYLTDYTFNGYSDSVTVAVSPAGPTDVVLQLFTTSNRTESLSLGFTVYGVSAGIPHQTYHDASSSVAVSERPPAPDFTLTVTPPVHSPNPIYWGDTANFTVELRSQNGFDGDIRLASTQLATYTTNNFLTNYTFDGISTTLTVHLNPGEIATLPLSLFTTTGRTDINQPLPFTVRGEDIADLGNVKTGTATVTVTVRPPDPDFDLVILPPNPHDPIYWGDTANFTLRLTSHLTGFDGDVTLTSSQLEEYKTTNGYLTNYTFDGASDSLTVAVSPAGPTDVVLQLFTTSGRTDSQNLGFTVYGVSTDIPHQTYHDASGSVLVEMVPLPLDFEIFITPAWQETDDGGAVEYTVWIERDPGFTETIRLTNDLISNYSAYIAQATFDITDFDGITDSTTLHVTTKDLADSHLIDNFVVTGTAVDGSPQHSVMADLQINVAVVLPPPPTPDFSILISPDWQETDTGGEVTYTVTVTPINNFTDRVILTHNLLSDFADYISAVDFDVLQLDQDNDWTTDMHIITKNITNSHLVTFTVTGTAISGSPVRADDADLQINVAGSPIISPPGGGGGGGTYTPPAPTTGGSTEDFTVQVTPITNTTINPGQSATYQVNIIRLGGFTGPVTLSTDVLQLNSDVASATFGKITIPTGETSTTLILVARPNAVIDSNTIFNVTGTTTALGDRADDAPVAIVIPFQLPSTGPEAPSIWFWLATLLMTLIGWQQLHQPVKKHKI